MKPLSLLLIILSVLLVACGNNPSENGAVDSVSRLLVVDSLPKSETSSPIVNSAAAQAELDKLNEGFEKPGQGSWLSYSSQFSIGGSEAQYFYDGYYSLKYRHTVASEEGGFQEESLVEYQSNKPIRSLKTLQGGSPDFMGFLFYQDGQPKIANVNSESYVKDGKIYYRYKISPEELPEGANTKGMMDNFDFENDLHTNTVLKNVVRFKLVEGLYEFYIRNDTAETGEQNVEVYRIDSALFEKKFLKK